jgi:hypothetical protein
MGGAEAMSSEIGRCTRLEANGRSTKAEGHGRPVNTLRKAIKVSDAQMKTLDIQGDAFHSEPN